MKRRWLSDIGWTVAGFLGGIAFLTSVVLEVLDLVGFIDLSV